MSESARKKTGCAFLTLLILSLLPMLFVAIYARPLADDFGYSAATHLVWNTTHSIPELFSAVAREVRETYNDWQGSFSAIALFALEPAVFSEKAYGISTFILVGFFLLGTYLIIRALIPDDKWVGLTVFSVAALISIQTLPHPFQGFYWWNGASYYTLFYSFMLIEWALILKNKLPVLAVILGFIIGGGNLVTGLLNLEVIFIMMVLEVIKKVSSKSKEKDEANALLKKIAVRGVVFISSLAGFLLNVTAPGNSVRASESVGMPAAKALAMSFLEAYNYSNEWFNLPVVLMILILLPFMFAFAKEKKEKICLLPLAVQMLIIFCLFASLFTPTEYSMSEVGPRRIQDVRYYFFILSIVYIELEAALRLCKIFEKTETVKAVTYGYAAFLMVGVVLFCAMYTIPRQNRDTLTSIAAARSLLIGEAKNYAAERDEWTRILDGDDKEVSLPALYNHPNPIYYVEFDITGDPEDYRDISMCDFYGKESIIIEGR